MPDVAVSSWVINVHLLMRMVPFVVCLYFRSRSRYMPWLTFGFGLVAWDSLIPLLSQWPTFVHSTIGTGLVDVFTRTAPAFDLLSQALVIIGLATVIGDLGAIPPKVTSDV